MICFIALIVFGILGIFSSTYRALAIEAFDCVFRRVTFRKCTTGLDTKLKTRISTGLLKRNKTVGGFVFRHFEAISWALTALTIISLVLTVWGLYNFVAFGNCNGAGSNQFCVYNTLGGLSGTGTPDQITGTPSLATGQWEGNPSAALTIVEFGCFSCPFTKQAEPEVERILSEYDGRVNRLFKFFPLPNHPYSREAALAAACAADQNRFGAYKDLLFENQLRFAEEGVPAFVGFARSAGLDENAFSACFVQGTAAPRVKQTTDEGIALKIYGTPTFFIGDTVLVGPQSYEQLKSVVEKEIAKKGYP